MNTITCQGAALNISPFVSTTYGFATPFESHFDRPVYSRRDIEGNFDDDGTAVPSSSKLPSISLLLYTGLSKCDSKGVANPYVVETNGEILRAAP